ncbi:hypothetical protein TNCV_4655871 [Trichonephila clavipes]|nr:hypothetical protein TNCV_4655871 [Trichonephila clavipes]
MRRLLLLFLMPPDLDRQIQANEIHHGKELDVRMSLAVAWSTIQSWASYLSFPSTNLTRELATRRLFRVPPCHKDTIHLQASMSSLGFEPRSYETAVNVANHYTGWTTGEKINVVNNRG